MAMHSEPLHNGILRALGREDLEILLPACTHREMKAGEVLEHRMQAVETVFFPTNGVASVVARGEGGKELETGPIGWEGMTGLPVILGVEMSTTETLVQIGGHALAAPATVVRRLIAQSPTAKQVFDRYAYAFGLQVVHTALAGSLSDVQTRLARWILMLHDRIEGDAIPVTHEFVAVMLGVRRPGVTVALHALEGEKLIKSTRGLIQVTDRAGLEAKCGAIYGEPEREYRRVIGSPLKMARMDH